MSEKRYDSLDIGTQQAWDKMGKWYFGAMLILALPTVVGVIIYNAYPFLIIPFWVVIALLVVVGVVLYLSHTIDFITKAQYD